MKNDIIHNNRIASRQTVVLISLLIVVAVIFQKGIAIAQASNDSVSKLSFNMNVSSIITDGTRSLKVFISRKENKKTIVVDDLKSPLNLYLNEVKEHDASTRNGWMGKVYLNNEGKAEFALPAWFKKFSDSVHAYTFIVKMQSDPKYENAEEQITIADSKVKLEYEGEDSVKTVTATLYGWKDNAFVPVPKAELKLCIKRTFNFLPFGDAEGNTDENGAISGELPLDIPGNTNSTLTIAARLEDDDTYGTVEVTKDIPWAVLPKTNPVRGRTLWSPGDNAPWVLVISSLSIIAIIWGTIFYLVYLLFKIKKLGRT